MTVQVRHTGLFVLNMRTRMPFRYGIATLTALPHLFVQAVVEVDGRAQAGVAADGLPPKWFTKDPATSFQDDLDDMLAVIRSACRFARQAGPAPTVFDLWQQVYRAQERWGTEAGHPPLLWSFGTSLVERAVIDAFCRATATPFAAAARTNALGIRLGDLHPPLAGARPQDLLPARPLQSIVVRHTVGLADPLTGDEIPAAERVEDGLPQSLDDCIRTYGLTHFKVKIGGDPAHDLERLRRIARVLEHSAAPDYSFTLDGNEQYTTVADFQTFWQALAATPNLAAFLGHLLFVEQPLHRDVALSAPAGAALQSWPERPPLIVDESGATLDSLPTALERGYQGISHKNCKGVFKGIADACLIAQRRRQDPAGRYLLSGEDLANVGPVALLQDLAVLATLGVEHAERNGHHYFAGLNMLPQDLQEQVLANHGDLYRPHAMGMGTSPHGYPTLNIAGGAVAFHTVVEAPFGLAFALDPSRFTPLERWNFDTLDG